VEQSATKKKNEKKKLEEKRHRTRKSFLFFIREEEGGGWRVAKLETQLPRPVDQSYSTKRGAIPKSAIYTSIASRFRRLFLENSRERKSHGRKREQPYRKPHQVPKMSSLWSMKNKARWGKSAKRTWNFGKKVGWGGGGEVERKFWLSKNTTPQLSTSNWNPTV
jgi:hypothetical protein